MQGSDCQAGSQAGRQAGSEADSHEDRLISTWHNGTWAVTTCRLTTCCGHGRYFNACFAGWRILWSTSEAVLRGRCSDMNACRPHPLPNGSRRMSLIRCYVHKRPLHASNNSFEIYHKHNKYWLMSWRCVCHINNHNRAIFTTLLHTVCMQPLIHDIET